MKRRIPPRRRGVVLMLVLVVLAASVTMASTYLGRQQTATAVAENVKNHAGARGAAESGVQLALAYIQATDTWRSDQSVGVWASNVSVAGGTVTITASDPDGDLANNTTDPVTITAVGTFDGVSHRASVVVQPGAATSAGNRLLFVTNNASSPHSEDLLKQAQFEAWGYTVTYLDENASQSAFDAATANADVAFVTEDVYSSNVNTKLNAFTGGVVTDETHLWDDLEASQSSASFYNDDEIDIVNTTHEITSGLSSGRMVFLNSSRAIARESQGELGSGAVILAERISSSDASWVAYEAGASAADGSAMAGRRVVMPMADGGFVFSHLNAAGLDVYKRSIDWAAGGGASTPTTSTLGSAVALYEFNQVTVPAPTVVARWRLDDVGSGAPSDYGVTLADKLTLTNNGVIDSYDSSMGDYGGSNQGSNASVGTNSTSSNDIEIDGGQIRGNVYVGPGGNPSSVIDTSGGGSVTGSTGAQSASTAVEPPSPPSLPSHTGNQTFSGGSHTIGSSGSDTLVHYNRLTIENGAQVTIRGDVVLAINNTFELKDGDIELDAGATLTIWANHNVTIENGSTINDDSSRTEDLALYVYGNNRNLNLKDGTISGLVWVDRDVTIENDSEVFGLLIAGDDISATGGGTPLHVDTALLASGGLYASGGASVPTTATDDTGDHDGAYRNGATTVSGGQDGRAGSFDGSDDFVEVPHDDAFKLDSGAISFWFYANDLNGNQGLVSRDSTGYDNGGHFSIRLLGDDLWVRMQSTSQSYIIQENNSISANTWHHVAYTWGVGGTRLFLDGALVDTQAYAGGLGATSGGAGNEEPWTFGVNQWQSGNGTSSGWKEPFHGRMDDIRLYNGNLTENQATQLASAQTVTTDLDPAVVEDTSGVGVALDLTVSDPANVSWVSGGGAERERRGGGGAGGRDGGGQARRAARRVGRVYDRGGVSANLAHERRAFGELPGG
ncbi:MAG: LamG domain-containing protein [Planctomycetota bacterium]